MPMDRVVAVAAQQMPDTTLSVRVPQTADGAYVVFAIHEIGPTTGATTVIDHATGEVLMHRTNSQFPALSWWATWNYPLHVGSILGLPTKILWLLACIVLMLMPITGVWMWWQRRPKGRSGFPRKPDTKVPRWLAGVIAALCFVLPALGASVLLIILGERATWLVRGKFVVVHLLIDVRHWIERFQFDSRVGRRESPICSAASFVPLALPSGDCGVHGCGGGEAPRAQALTREQAQFHFGHVQPTAVLGRVNQADPTRQAMRRFSVEREV
jgi:hypothetical protein